MPTTPSSRFALVVSTGGSVFQRTYLADRQLRESLCLAVADRACGATDFAAAQGVATVVLKEPCNNSFSDALLAVLVEHQIDYVLLFFSRLLRGRLLQQFHNRIINFHPSLLPACPGLRGFEDTLAGGSLLAGCTAHFVEEGMDTGPVIQQGFLPIDPQQQDFRKLRHQVFLAQCASLSQVVSWACQHRLKAGPLNRAIVERASYDVTGGFLPALETEAAKNLLADTP